ncbi:MAG: hypothetical protein RLZZ228_1093 [Actinomycetota bacterium]|jgi:hypothetical protein
MTGIAAASGRWIQREGRTVVPAVSARREAALADD